MTKRSSRANQNGAFRTQTARGPHGRLLFFELLKREDDSEESLLVGDQYDPEPLPPNGPKEEGRSFHSNQNSKFKRFEALGLMFR